MALVVDENTYVTEAEATSYFDSKYGFTLWAAETDKDGALQSAAQQLDTQCTWYGYPVDTNQDRAFPRTPDADPTPQEVKDAQCEIAYAIVETGSTVTDGGDALTKLKAGSVELEFKATSTGNPLVNSLTTSLLSQFGLCMGGGGTKLVPMERS